MVVKVVSDKPTKPKRVVCSRCTYSLEYTGVDVHEGMNYDYGGGSDPVYWIVCPHCKEEVSVSRWR